MNRSDSLARLRHHMHAAVDLAIELVAGAMGTGDAANDVIAPRRRATAATVLEASADDRAFAANVLRANGLPSGGKR